MLKVMVKMDEVVMLPAGYPTVPTPPSSQTWWSPSLPFLPRAKQLDTRKHVQFARFLVCAFAVARAAASAACVCLLPLPRLSLLADQGAGDSRCPGHVSPVE